ncbi:MAG: tRNA (adenosine(37)-N6)-threonylcarbamoyltransferase complex transferase subunit TsaD [Planctomycetota bacterium]
MSASDLVLGIESSCDETAAAVVRAGTEIVSSVVASQDARHAPFGGIVPEIASRAHTEVITKVIARALERADVTAADLAGIAVSNRPGLLGSLLVGLTAAKALAWAWELPLVAVHHLEAHLYGSTWAEGLEAPFVGLVCSGGHTSLYLCEDPLHSRRLGATTDDAAGEAFDKVASLLELGYPGGPAIERAARGVDPRPLRFPRSRIKGRPWDFTFSGLKTAVLYHVRGIPPAAEAVIPRDDFPRVAAAFQEAAVEMLVRPTIDAARELGCRSVTATGGVAANSCLREHLERAAGEAGLACAFAPRALCTDNAVMVAGRGWHDLAAGVSDPLDIDANARPERAPYGSAPSGGALRKGVRP